MASGDEFERPSALLTRRRRGHAVYRDIEQHFTSAELRLVEFVARPEKAISLSLILFREADGQSGDPFGGPISVF